MNRCVRSAPPEPLAARAQEWTRRWLEQCAAKGAAEFRWPQVDSKPLNQHLTESLRAMTSEHCSYCDNWIPPGVAETIDHFRPKACGRFPGFAFEWTNLFLTCWVCQKAKGEQFDELLLKPDEPGYDFDRYFVYRPRTGTLEPNPNASPEDRRRADRTIQLLRLNENGFPRARQRECNLIDAAAFRFCQGG